MRIPGEGTDRLINRRQEAAVYQVIDGKHICDDIAYINPQNGYKITEFLEGARVCNPLNYEDVKKCMMRLHAFHDLKLKVNHEFDIFGRRSSTKHCGMECLLFIRIMRKQKQMFCH